jgi:hypothetical protein
MGGRSAASAVWPGAGSRCIGSGTRERTFSPAVARAYAGHSENSGGITGTYGKATLEEVSTALAALTGEPHPLAVAASDDDPAPG